MTKFMGGLDEDLTAGGLGKARLEILLQKAQAVEVVFECRWIVGVFGGDYMNDTTEEVCESMSSWLSVLGAAFGSRSLEPGVCVFKGFVVWYSP